MKYVHYTLLAALLAVAASAQERPEPFIPLKAEVAPVIDGVLDDPIWRTAPHVTGFKTYHPDFGRDMAEQTVVYYAYDTENLYFAFRCFDREPDKIKAAVSSRDSIRPDDWICINLDPFDDQQALYAFYVNPLGIQADSVFAANVEDYGVDLVWYSAGRIDDQGYTLEVRIPFKSLRFSRKNPVEMGVVFERRVSRQSEHGTYPPLDPKKGMNFAIQMKPLSFDEIKHYTLLELLPAVTFSHRASDQGSGLASEGSKGDFSLTAKYGVSSRLTLDATYNPDFSQIEADAGQVDFNQRYALFYPEKRPFFLEGKEIFNFGGNASGDPLGAIVHTRTIVDPLVGVKLSGKIGDKNMLSSIYALDELPETDGHQDQAQFAIFRYKRALNSDSYVGGMLTDREIPQGFNRVGGVDGHYRFSESSAVGFHAFMSQDRTDSLSVTEKGHALGVDLTQGNRDGNLRFAVQDISENFHTETGYVTRTGVTLFRAGVVRSLHVNGKLIRRLDPQVNATQIRDTASGKYETSESFDLRLMYTGSSSIQAGYVYSTEIYLARKFDTRAFRLTASNQLSKQISFSAKYIRGLKIRYTDNPFQGYGNDLTGTFTYQPSDKLNLSLNLTYSDLYQSSDFTKVYNYTIIRSRNVYQMNKYLFFRAIVEYNSFRRRVLTDFLASFTYIPGTVIHFGYGSIYEKPDDALPRGDLGFRETARSFFFKASYLWRL